MFAPQQVTGGVVTTQFDMTAMMNMMIMLMFMVMMMKMMTKATEGI